MRQTAGFTAIELLTVISIGIFLAGLGLPTILNARVRGQLGKAVGKVEEIHGVARRFAERSPRPIQGATGVKSYGVTIWYDGSTLHSYAALIYGTSAADLLLRNDASGKPVLKYDLGKRLEVWTSTGNGTVATATATTTPVHWFYESGTGRPMRFADPYLAGNAPTDIGVPNQAIKPPIIVAGGGVLRYALPAVTNDPMALAHLSLRSATRQFAYAISVYRLGNFSGSTLW